MVKIIKYKERPSIPKAYWNEGTQIKYSLNWKPGAVSSKNTKRFIEKKNTRKVEVKAKDLTKKVREESINASIIAEKKGNRIREDKSTFSWGRM